MRKHLLRILTVLLVICLGAFLFVACGDTNDDNGDQGSGTQQGGDQTQKYTVTMAANENVTFTIVEPTTAGPYAEGTTVKFTVTPKTGYKIDSVKNGTTALTAGSDGKYSVTVGKANIVINVTASATQQGGDQTEKHNVTMAANENVTFTIVEPTTAGPYAEGTDVKFTVTPKNGYKVDSVKNGTTTLTADSDGKYTVKVGKADIVITVTTSSSGSVAPEKYTLSFDGDDENVDIVIDNQAASYAAGTTVKFTVTAKSGYTLVSVKNGTTTLEAQNGKYSVTLNANTTITVTTSGQGGQTDNRNLTDFANASVSKLGENGIQVVVRAKAVGYADADAVKADIRLVVGTQNVEPTKVDAPTGDSEIWTIYFNLETIPQGLTAKTQLTLKGVNSNKTYENIVNETADGSAQVGNSTYTLSAESGKLYLNVAGQQGGEGDEFEKGELVENANTTKALVNSGKNDDAKQDDGFMMWWVQDVNWNNGSVVTMTPAKEDVASALKDGKISFSYTGGNVPHSVQLFYKNTHLAQHTEYILSLDITLSQCDSLAVIVNGKSMQLESGSNHIEVKFEHYYDYDANRASWDQWRGNYGVDIQFQGTEAGTEQTPNTAVPGGKVGIEVSNVAWYTVKEQGGEVPTEKTLSFSNAKVEAADGKAYLVVTAASTLYSEDDLKSFVIYDHAKELTVDATKSTFTVNGNSTLYFDITSLTSAESWYWLHLKINGENWDAAAGGNFKYEATVDKDQKIEVGNHRYYVTLDKDPQLIIVIEEVNVFYSAHLELADGKVYYVLDANMEKYTEEQIRKSVLFDGDRTFNSVNEKFETISEGNGRFRLYFDITSLTEGKTFYPHIKLVGADDKGADINVGDVKCAFDVHKGIVTVNKTRYTMSSSYDMPCVDVTTIPDNFYETTKVELISKENKAVLVLTGTYIGYEKDALKGILEALHIDLQNNPSPEQAVKDGREDWAVYNGFPRTVTVEEEGTWKIELEVTMGLKNLVDKKEKPIEWNSGAYTVHFGTKNDQGDGADLKVVEAVNGQSVKIGEIVYTLRNYYGSSKDSEYWGCIGLTIEDPSYVAKSAEIDYSTVKFEEADGKVYLVIGGTNHGCEKADFKFDVEFITGGNGKLYPDFTFETADGKFTIKVDLSKVIGNAEYYMHLVVLGSGAGNVATQTNEGYNVEKVDPYEIEIRHTGWGPWSWVLKVASRGVVVFNFVKGEATGEDPEIELGQPNDSGVYTIRLPENPYTAPANKYFRGWLVDEVVYFPGEQLDVKGDSVVTLTAVWEDLVSEEKTNNAAVVSRKWNASATPVNVYDGTTVKLVAQITDSTPLDWHGIINDGTMMLGNKEYFAHFRVDGYVWTTGTNTGDSNTTEELKVGVAEESNFVKDTYTALYKNAETAVTHVITASLNKNVLTYIYEVYADYTEGGENVAATKYVWRATLSYPTSMLTMKFMIDDGVQDPDTGTMTVKSATLKYYDYALSVNQAPTAENPIVVGASDNSLPYSGNTPVWTGDLKKGETVTLKGTMTSKAELNWHAPLFHVYDGAAPVFNLRGDAFVNGNTSNNVAPFSVSNGWKINTSTDGSNPSVNPDGSDVNAANWWDGVRAILAQADVEITYDYTGEDIVVTFKATSTKQDALYENFGKVYVCTFTIEKNTGAFADTLKIGLGGEACYVRITSLTRTSVKPAYVPFKNGGEADAKVNKDVWYWWFANGDGGCTVNMKDAKYDLDRNVITLDYETTSGTKWWGVQLFYKNSKLEEGKQYKLTVNIAMPGEDTVEYKVHLNGENNTLKGGNNTVEVTYTEGAGASFSLQFGWDGQNDTMVTEAKVELSGWNWEEVQSTPVEPEDTRGEQPTAEEQAKYAKGGQTGGALSAKEAVNAGKDASQDDTVMLWWVQGDNWGCGTKVTMTTNKYESELITMTYSGGDQNYSVQAFYKNTNLTDNTLYYVSVKLQSTKDMTLTLNGTSVVLKAGEAKVVEVLFRNGGKTGDKNPMYGLDMQMPGMVEETTVTISEVKWYEAVQKPAEDAEAKTIVPVSAKYYNDLYLSIVVSETEFNLISTADKAVVNDDFTGTDWDGKGYQPVGKVEGGYEVQIRLSLAKSEPGDYEINWVIGEQVIATYTYTVAAAA